MIDIEIDAQPPVFRRHQKIGVNLPVMGETAEAVGLVARTGSDDQSGSVDPVERRPPPEAASPVGPPGRVESNASTLLWSDPVLNVDARSAPRDELVFPLRIIEARPIASGGIGQDVAAAAADNADNDVIARRASDSGRISPSVEVQPHLSRFARRKSPAEKRRNVSGISGAFQYNRHAAVC